MPGCSLSRALSLGSGDDLQMIKFARARSLKRNNSSLFSRLSRAEKYLTVRISRRDVDTVSHVEVSLLLRLGAEDKSTCAALCVRIPACSGTRMNIHVKEGRKR